MILLALVLLPMLFAAACYIIGRRDERARDWFSVGATIFIFILSWFASGEIALGGVCGMGLTFAASGFQKILAALTAFIWLGSHAFAREYFANSRNRNRYHAFSLITLGAVEGVFLSGDLFTTFVFFEIMSFTSWALVKQEETPAAIRAGQTYLAVAVICGMATLAGLFTLYHNIGTLAFDEMFAAAQIPDKTPIYVSAALILAGFGAKAGMFPAHIWLPEAHPAAPAPASAILSCILTKTGVFGVIILSAKLLRYDADWGMAVSILGAATMLSGAALALISIDLKRVLACSSLSQIGFILVGVGMQGLLGEENLLAANGTLLHIINHSLIKLALFTCAGVVYLNAHNLSLNKIRGCGRGKPFFTITFALCALSLSGIPGFGGYVSKTLLHESIIEYGGAPIIEWIFVISGGFTLAYMTKLFVCLFIEKGDSKPIKSMSPMTSALLALCAALMPVIGLAKPLTDAATALAQPFMGGEGVIIDINYFGGENLLGGAYSIAIGIFTYIVLARRLLMKNGEYVDIKPAWLSLEDRVYRPLIVKILPKIGLALAAAPNAFADVIIAFMARRVFNKGGDSRAPKEDSYFGRYSDEPFLRRGFTDTLAFSFLLFGLCVVITLIFVLLHKI